MELLRELIPISDLGECVSEGDSVQPGGKVAQGGTCGKGGEVILLKHKVSGSFSILF